MRDASAYNIQFLDTAPVFIDYLSFARYKEGMIWEGHHQFCEQFFNPLLLFSKAGIEYQSWYRGTLTGISTSDTSRLLPLRTKILPQVFTNVVIKNHLDKSNIGKETKIYPEFPKKSSYKKISRRAIGAILSSLRSFIENLSTNTPRTNWQKYSDINSYSKESADQKRLAVSEFCKKIKPRRLLDVGCNSGEFSELALMNGAHQVIGLDADHGALTLALKRAETKKLRLLPLLQDLKNLSPSQGWDGLERRSLFWRIAEWQPDALLALAIIHHLAITGNVPLPQILDLLIGFAHYGIIEFIPKDDLMVRIMLRNREDIFPSYSQPTFEAELKMKARIVNRTILANGRILYEYSA